MSLHLAERKELFFILSTKLEKEDAELLEKKISTWILEREIKNNDVFIKDLTTILNDGFNSYKIGSKGDFGKVSLEGFHNGLRRVKGLFELKNKNNLFNLTEML